MDRGWGGGPAIFDQLTTRRIQNLNACSLSIIIFAKIVVETKYYGPDTINSVISGSHRSSAHTAHAMIHEVLMSMMFQAFIAENPEKEMDVEGLGVDCQSETLNSEVWNTTKQRVEMIEKDFEIYLKETSLKSKSFAFWNTYVSDLYPIVRDLANSMRSGDWILYLSAVERATS